MVANVFGKSKRYLMQARHIDILLNFIETMIRQNILRKKGVGWKNWRRGGDIYMSEMHIQCFH